MVFTPMSSPWLSSKGPPLFPGLMAASVCTTPRMGRPVMLLMSLFTPETIPVVRVWSKPKGLPIAYTWKEKERARF